MNRSYNTRSTALHALLEFYLEGTFRHGIVFFRYIELERGWNVEKPATAEEPQISQRVPLGNRRNIAAAGAIGRQSAQDRAAAFAANIMPIVASVQATGVTTLAGIANALNGRGVRTQS